MAITQNNEEQQMDKREEENQHLDQLQQKQEVISYDCNEMLNSLPKERGWRTPYIYLFQNFWCQPKLIQAIISSQRHFKSLDTDVVIATIPKSGTTWLKAIAFAVVHRRRFPVKSPNHPLLTSNPHELVPFLEYKLYANDQLPDLSGLPSPRLVATHTPYAALPDTVKNSGCRVVYLCRNPLDTFVSIWHYIIKIRPENLGPFSLEEAFDMYCKGAIAFGPYWDHMLSYWKQTLENPNKVLFLRYEEMKEDIGSELKKLGEFLGCPFSEEEEREGVVEGIVEICSFKNLKELEVNKEGKAIANFENKHLFRKGVVGDWVNLLSPSMVERLSRIMVGKLEGSGISFKVCVS